MRVGCLKLTRVQIRVGSGSVRGGIRVLSGSRIVTGCEMWFAYIYPVCKYVSVEGMELYDVFARFIIASSSDELLVI